MTEAKAVEQHILDIVVAKDEVSWKSIIMQYMQTNSINPWDVDVSHLAGYYLNYVQDLKEHDFRVSGKMILAAALFLKIKSKRLLEDDLNALDQLFISASQEEQEDDIVYEDFSLDSLKREGDSEQVPELRPRVPLPRRRKVSVYDLIFALEKALEVRERKVLREINVPQIEVPTQHFNAEQAEQDMHAKLLDLQKEKITFSELLPGMERNDKIYTLIPLLQLRNKDKVDLEQEKAFEEIFVLMQNEQEDTSFESTA